jgi:NADH dehydrogenase
MRIVLLGATGFVGRHLLPELSRRGHHCIVVCRDKNRCRQLQLVVGVDLKQIPALTVQNLTTVLPEADAVINLTGILNERGRNGLGFRKVHVGIVENLIEACRITGIRRVIQVSALNAGKGNSHYLASKGKAEDVLRQTDFIDVTIVQPSVIFGDGDAFFNRFASLLKWTPLLPLACPGALLQPVWVGDVVKAIGEILQKPETIGRSLELVGPNVFTLRKLVRMTASTSGYQRCIIGLSDPVSRLQGVLMDFVPGKPFSSDNYKSLQVANVSQHNALPELGITPNTIKAVMPAYLAGTRHQRRLDQWRQRAGVG